MGGKTEFPVPGEKCAKLLGTSGRLCPKCGSDRVWGNGRTRAGKRGWRCGECGRTFVEARHGIPQEVRTIADRMIQEEIEPVTIAVILKGWVSRRWIYARRKKNQAIR
ncbi:MAG: transposase [Desulfobulbia bacterium]